MNARGALIAIACLAVAGCNADSDQPLFADAASYSIQDALTPALGPVSLASGNVDGDLAPDLITVNAATSNISVLLNDGAGGFALGSVLSVGSSPADIALGNFNTLADSFLDAAIANAGSGTVSIYSGDGAGGFALSTLDVKPQSPSAMPVALGAADFDGDGDLDLAVADAFGNKLLIYAGDGTGAFAPPPLDPSQYSFALSGEPTALIVADLFATAGPVVQDIAVMLQSGQALLFKGLGNAGFVAQSLTVTGGGDGTSLAAGDIQGDGLLDLAMASGATNNLFFFKRIDDATFASPTEVFSGDLPVSLALTDIDGDASADMVSVNQVDDTVAVLLGDRRGVFQRPNLFGVGAAPADLVAEDVNGDGRTDVVTANEMDHSVSVLIAN